MSAKQTGVSSNGVLRFSGLFLNCPTCGTRLQPDAWRYLDTIYEPLQPPRKTLKDGRPSDRGSRS